MLVVVAQTGCWDAGTRTVACEIDSLLKISSPVLVIQPYSYFLSDAFDFLILARLDPKSVALSQSPGPSARTLQPAGHSYQR